MDNNDKLITDEEFISKFSFLNKLSAEECNTMAIAIDYGDAEDIKELLLDILKEKDEELYTGHWGDDSDDDNSDEYEEDTEESDDEEDDEEDEGDESYHDKDEDK